MLDNRDAGMRKVAVLGGGMTGLAAAFYLYREARAQGVPIAVTLLEASERLGGRINTLRRDGFVIERGPESFLARKLPMVELAEALGLEDEFVGTNPAAKFTYIAHGDELHAMPAGLNLGVPTDAGAFLETGLLSEEGKRRALAEAAVPAAAQGGEDVRNGSGAAEDETVGAFLERRFGAEMVTRIFEPLLAGIYAGDLYGLSLDATFPQFKALEAQYGSVIRGLAEQRRAAQGQRKAGTAQGQAAGRHGTVAAEGQASAQRGAEAAQSSSAASVLDRVRNRTGGSLFLTFRHGLLSVVEALEERLREQGCEIRLDARVTALSRGDDKQGQSRAYRLETDNGQGLDVDAVVIALPAAGIAGLLEPHADVSAMRDIRYVSVANVVFGYDEAGFDHPLDGSGFLVPRGEGRLITASTWTSSKWQHTAPQGKRLIRCYVGRAGEEANVELSDEEMTVGVRRDLRELMGLAAAPSFVEITRLRRSMPQYPLGHRVRTEAFLSALAARMPGVIPAGQPFGGVGLPDCAAQGKQAAESLVRRLGERYNKE